ncbi:SRPBCC family protein [Perlabentimonas gracilis]|uniref:SRPBCC family protein n=1 Tax=Perlabentimonas gracilis TaxID=2715279 RepID=UPI00140BFD02|nr:SRPBCC domain-containing protein [Perlabentimonas gracilis]NHB68629.1 SRPBCC domain-containing protein [Perlabentimonas gracilis]
MISTKIIIKESAAKVWQALTDKSQMKEWYFDIADFELRAGAIFNFYEPGGENLFHHRCQIIEIIPKTKLAHTWSHPSHSKGVSTVTWLLSEVNGITEVTLKHEGIENFADAGPEFAPENYQMGWEGLMSALKNYIYGIRKQTYQIEINASPEVVWDVLLNDDTYRKWTNVFCEGSFYKGELKPGGRVHFLTPNGDGMYSNIVFYTPHSNILFQHIGEIVNFVEQPLDDATEKWTGAFESYTLKSNGKTTTLVAEVDLTPDHLDSFNKAFPKGLDKIKELSELSEITKN